MSWTHRLVRSTPGTLAFHCGMSFSMCICAWWCASGAWRSGEHALEHSQKDNYVSGETIANFIRSWFFDVNSVQTEGSERPDVEAPWKCLCLAACASQRRLPSLFGEWHTCGPSTNRSIQPIQPCVHWCSSSVKQPVIRFALFHIVSRTITVCGRSQAQFGVDANNALNRTNNWPKTREKTNNGEAAQDYHSCQITNAEQTCCKTQQHAKEQTQHETTARRALTDDVSALVWQQPCQLSVLWLGVRFLLHSLLCVVWARVCHSGPKCQTLATFFCWVLVSWWCHGAIPDGAQLVCGLPRGATELWTGAAHFCAEGLAPLSNLHKLTYVHWEACFCRTRGRSWACFLQASTWKPKWCAFPRWEGEKMRIPGGDLRPLHCRTQCRVLTVSAQLWPFQHSAKMICKREVIK